MAAFDAREALLATLQRWCEAALSDQPWVDGRNQADGRNAIMDAEMLECLLLPQFYVGRLSLANPRHVDEGMARVLNRLDPQADETFAGGLADAVPEEIVERLGDWAGRYRDDEADPPRPTFSAGAYLEASDEQTQQAERHPWVVDAFTMSLSVSLQGMFLIDRWRELSVFQGSTLEGRAQEVRDLLSERLTHAMAGLCRSFAFVQMDREEWEAKSDRVWPAGANELDAIWQRLSRFHENESPDAGSGSRRRRQSSGPRGKAYEAGWSWGPTPPTPYEDEYRRIDAWPAQDLYAEPAPYLYFTVGAIDGVADLASPAIIGTELLDADQSLLANRLGFFRELTSSYWSTLAFADTEDGTWAIESPPWRTADGSSSDYWTLYLMSVALGSEQAQDRFGGEQKLSRLLSLIEELAQRGRVTREPHPQDGDPAVRLHDPPGTQLDLRLATPELEIAAISYRWSIYDFAPRLLKLTAQAFSLATERTLRDRASSLIEDIWDQHLKKRRVRPEHDAFAWDDIRNAFKQHPVNEELDRRVEQTGSLVGSWYITERVVEALVQVIAAEERRATTGRLTGDLVSEMIDDLRFLAAQFSTDDMQKISRELSSLTSLLDVSPTLALAKAIDVGKSVEKTRRERERAQD